MSVVLTEFAHRRCASHWALGLYLWLSGGVVKVQYGAQRYGKQSKSRSKQEMPNNNTISCTVSNITIPCMHTLSADL